MTPVVSKGFSKYLAVPFRSKGRDMLGWDCYGLYRFVLAERHGILVPSYAEDYTNATDASVVAAFAVRVHWLAVPPGEVREGDAVVFCIGGVPWHCGYVIEPGIMLHAQEGCETAIESYTSALWRKRVEGIYRCKS